MKKTLIALMAIAGGSMSVFGLTTQKAQESLTLAIVNSGYVEGNDFSLSITNLDSISNDNMNAVVLSDGYFLFTHIGHYLAFTNSSDGNNIVWAGIDENGIDTTSKLITMTLASASNVWFSWNINDEGEATKGTNIDFSNLDISYDSAETLTTITFTYADGDKDILKIQNYELNAKDITLQNMESVGSVSFKTVPEPTTATLSLLALAGLAARRRRK